MPDEERARPSDEVILTHLGSAVLLCWNQLPLNAQARILDQADDIIGLAPIPDIRSRIVELLLRISKITQVGIAPRNRDQAARAARRNRTAP